MRLFPLVLILALTGCSANGSGDAGRFPPLDTMKTFTAASQLKGNYRVAGIDGTEFTSLHDGFEVTISGDKIEVRGNCTSNGWSYRFDGAKLVTAVIEGPTCRRAVTDEEAALGRVFAGAVKASPTPWDGIMIEGTGGTVTLVVD
ncbi:MAG: hypothetical protein P0Y56_11830 [Candidatus Andeanibacterium colombiense]|uniref:DUF306 domain-containing protein n=1 Tax=Candidatus Andeanibacterium colombiense TaxID=3121345 RepID=A0AAJ5X4K1_9SPHN|nr:MAG: hypothetical protein P0Y56_11830 [Sphingomonadaceae bacterium]